MIGYVPTHLVNLDALIQREDFESSGAAAGSYGTQPTFKLAELEQKNHYFGVLRKPDFQRDTNNWSPKMILDFIASFLDNELIPSIILWISRESNKVFIIDGAHRVSALIAWVNDDYGDGSISKKAFNFKVPPAQSRFHKQTKELVESAIGSYAELCHTLLNQDQATSEEKLRRARAMAIRQAPVQLVDGESYVAERSFFKINCTPVLIDDTELDIIRARNKPNAIATRAMIRAGTGHKYWRKFTDENRDEIEKQAGTAYNLVFGQIVDMGLQSVDVPRAGQPYSQEAFRMVLDMINIFNDVTPTMWREPRAPAAKKSPIAMLEDDVSGDATIAFLRNVVKIGMLVSGSASEYSGSIGLDQAVYSYGATGKFHPTALIASYKMAQWLRDTDQLREFTATRSTYEEFLIKHKHFINDIGHSKGSGTRSLDSLLTLHKSLFACLINGVLDDERIIEDLKKQPQLKGLGEEGAEVDGEPPPRKNFSKTAQDIALLREIIAGRALCTICNARMLPAFRSRDHIVRKEDGGMGGSDNLQFAHPYCNTTYKN